MTTFRPIVFFNRSQDEIKDELESDLEVSTITSESKQNKDMNEGFFKLLRKLRKYKYTFDVEKFLKTLDITSDQEKQLKTVWMSLHMYDIYKEQHSNYCTNDIWNEVVKSEEKDANAWVTEDTFKERLTEDDINERDEERLEDEINEIVAEKVAERVEKEFKSIVDKAVRERINVLTENKRIFVTERIDPLSNIEYVNEKEDKAFDDNIFGKVLSDNDILTSQRCLLTYSGKLDRKNITSFLETLGFPSSNTIVAYDTGNNKKILTRVYADLRSSNSPSTSTILTTNNVENKNESTNKRNRTSKIIVKGKMIRDTFDFQNKHPLVRILNRVIMERCVKNYLNQLNTSNPSNPQ